MLKWSHQLKQAGLSLDELLWQTVDYKPCINHFTKPEQVPAKTQTSLELAKKLKSRALNFRTNDSLFADASGGAGQ